MMKAEALAFGLRQRAPVTSACCSSTNVPTMLVCTNSPGPSIERSTWLSAAKCKITSGWKSASTARIFAASAMSARTNLKRG
jgi:hypothetical protein